MYAPRFELGTFGKVSRRAELAAEQALLDALTAIDRIYLAERPQTPELYQSGVRYRREPKRVDDWRDVPIMLASGFGDCEDLACWRAAEIEGAQAVPIQQIEAGGILYHVIVRLPDGSTEDPSKELGMT